MKKKKIFIAIITIIVICFTLGFNHKVYADDFKTSDFSGIYDGTGVSNLNTKSGKVISVVQIIGAGASLVALIVLGIKYMVSSPNEKASIKEKLIPYVVGTVIFFAASELVAIVMKFAFGLG